MPTYTFNRKAKFDYSLLEKYEAGLALFGFEVRAVKSGRISLRGSFVVIRNNEAWLVNADIPPYQPKNTPDDYNPTRSRKLLLHKKEIGSLIGKIKSQGLTLVPLKVYSKASRLKLEFALGRGKKKFDKRESLRKKEADRKIQTAMRTKS